MNTRSIQAGIIGAAGYTGGELIRLLLWHPHVRIAFAHSNSQAGLPVHAVHGDLVGETDLHFTDGIGEGIDVLFLCLGHGEARKFLEANPLPSAVRIIDLSQDFRIKDTASIDGRRFIYGLPELNKAAISSASQIANPGCFATAIQLGLLPIAGMLGEVYTTGITGSTGAGQGLSATSHFSWRANNVQAYKALQHQHMAEVGQSLRQAGAVATAVHFVPWRGDFPRGIYVSSTFECPIDEEEVKSLYKEYYAGAAFTTVSDRMIDLKQVVNTNKCLIFPEKAGSKLVVHSAIDNLLKGASGQAVQNMNLMFGLDEQAGLRLKASFF